MIHGTTVRYGVVNLVGHGNGNGVYRTRWQGDLFPNNRLTSPASPLQDYPNGVNEVGQTTMLDYDDMNARNGDAPIYVVAACSTGDWVEPVNFGAEIWRGAMPSPGQGGPGSCPIHPPGDSPARAACRTSASASTAACCRSTSPG